MNRTISWVRVSVALACAIAACGGGDDSASPQKNPSIKDPRTAPQVPNKIPGKKSNTTTNVPGKGDAVDNRPHPEPTYKLSGYSFFDFYQKGVDGILRADGDFSSDDRLVLSADGYQGKLAVGDEDVVDVGIQPTDTVFSASSPDNASTFYSADNGQVVAMCYGTNTAHTTSNNSNIVSVGFLTYPEIAGYQPLMKGGGEGN